MNAFFAQHLAALRDALRRLLASPLNTLLSLLVIGIALTLPSCRLGRCSTTCAASPAAPPACSRSACS